MIEFNPRLRLGDYFYLYEFIVSDEHPELLHGVVLNQEQINKFYYLVQFGLDPIRHKFGRVLPTSGYRPPMLNRLVGGVSNSAHLRCAAVDFVVPDADPFQVYVYITVDLKWPGEVVWYKPEKRFHLALPELMIKSDYIIKDVSEKKTKEI